MKILGLTGSVGMGKSTAAGMLRRMGVPVYDADAAVHRLLAPGGAAVAAVAAAFPGVAADGGIDRRALGARVFGDQRGAAPARGDPPSAGRARTSGASSPRARAARRRLVVMDVPLLFETGGERRCDAVMVVSAPRLPAARAGAGAAGHERGAASPSSARSRCSDAEKRRRADFDRAERARPRRHLAPFAARGRAKWTVAPAEDAC